MKVLAYNKYALYNYELLKEFEAGVILEGWEVKSIKDGRVSMKESYIHFKKNKLYLIGCHVSEWPGVKLTTLDLSHDRELLMHEHELLEIKTSLKQKGSTAVPVDFHIFHNRIKVKLALVKGKKLFDKRVKLKEEDQKREIERDLKHYGMLK